MMSTLSTTSSFGRPRFGNIADGLAVALAVSLPWSTSATSILLVLWLIALIPALTWHDLRRELVTCVYRKPHPALISVLAGKIPCSCVQIPCSVKKIPCSV
jgi:hypothetical protein